MLPPSHHRSSLVVAAKEAMGASNWRGFMGLGFLRAVFVVQRASIGSKGTLGPKWNSD